MQVTILHPPINLTERGTPQFSPLTLDGDAPSRGDAALDPQPKEKPAEFEARQEKATAAIQTAMTNRGKKQKARDEAKKKLEEKIAKPPQVKLPYSGAIGGGVGGTLPPAMPMDGMFGNVVESDGKTPAPLPATGGRNPQVKSAPAPKAPVKKTRSGNGFK